MRSVQSHFLNAQLYFLVQIKNINLPLYEYIYQLNKAINNYNIIEQL